MVVWGMSQPCLWHAPLMSVTWFVRMCDMTHWYVRNKSSRCVTSHIHTSRHTFIYVSRHTFICVSRHRSICVTSHIHICDTSHNHTHTAATFFLFGMTHPRVTWLIHGCDLTHSHVRIKSFICDMSHIHTATFKHRSLLQKSPIKETIFCKMLPLIHGLLFLCGMTHSMRDVTHMNDLILTCEWVTRMYAMPLFHGLLFSCGMTHSCVTWLTHVLWQFPLKMRLRQIHQI